MSRRWGCRRRHRCQGRLKIGVATAEVGERMFGWVVSVMAEIADVDMGAIVAGGLVEE